MVSFVRDRGQDSGSPPPSSATRDGDRVLVDVQTNEAYLCPFMDQPPAVASSLLRIRDVLNLRRVTYVKRERWSNIMSIHRKKVSK